jgi:flagellar basal body-associated protein FliL
MTNPRHRRDRKITIMKIVLIVLISAVIAGVVGGVTGMVSKWNAKSTTSISSTAVVNGTRLAREALWHGGAGHRRERGRGLYYD